MYNIQTAIPVFEGLLPEPYNSRILKLLFHFAYWHRLAKLRMHSDMTLEILDRQTAVLGDHLRKFQKDTCPAFSTRELRREAAARQHRQGKKGVSACKSSEPPKHRIHHKSRQSKTFSLKTYKLHALGDYVETIRRWGTTDSYSTEVVRGTLIPPSTGLLTICQKGELEHRIPKGNYRHTSKKNFTRQLARIERWKARICRLRQKLATPESQLDRTSDGHPAVDPAHHHHIGATENHPLRISTFLRDNSGDPAIKACTLFEMSVTLI